jgi:type IV fimbrial biogenesis protein FimT
MLRRAMKAKQTGFTLIELMFTIAVIAVLLGIGVPNFREFVMNSRMTSAANDLLGDLNLARTEAIKRRSQVVLCATDGGTDSGCSTSGSAFTAWLAFVDANGDNTFQSTEVVLRRHARVPTTINGIATGGLSVTYRPSGFSAPASATRVLFCDSRKNAATAGNLPAARAVTIGPAGRSGVTRPSTGCP